jgi:predicted transcriptional regulator
MEKTVGDKHQIVITSKRANHSTRRTKYDICSQILQSCINHQKTKFWLSSRLKLSWKVVDESLRFLTNRELIETIKRHGETVKYKTTSKGQEALRAYETLVENYFSL